MADNWLEEDELDSCLALPDARQVPVLVRNVRHWKTRALRGPSPLQLEALCNLLVVSGDMTSTAARQFRKLWE